MAWTVEFQPQAQRDLELISDYLFRTYRDLGDDPEVAYSRMIDRVRSIRQSASDLKRNPYRGTKRNRIGEGVRNITINQAIIWFEIVEDTEKVLILAFFFGGQDHVRHMLKRLLE